MAQKKLLFFMKILKYFVWSLVAIYLVINIAKADFNSDKAKFDIIPGSLKIEPNEQVTDLINDAKNTALKGIKEKYLELQKMINGSENRVNDSIIDSVFDSAITLRVFVSSSMNNQLLKSYITEAKKYKAILVFNGLPNDSWQELSKIVSEIVETSDEVAIQIDDEAFKRFGISSVPSFVLSKGDRDNWQFEYEKNEIYDKATGNISLRGFLRLVAEQGELAVKANQILEQGI